MEQLNASTEGFLRELITQ